MVISGRSPVQTFVIAMSRSSVIVALSSCLLGVLPCQAEEQQFILRQAAPIAPAKSAGAAKSRSGSATPLPFSSLIEHQVPAKHLPLEKIVISSDLVFEPAKDRLTDAGEAKLKTLMPVFRRLKSHPIEVVGHTDSLGFEDYNSELTLRQAQRIKSWLVAHGLAKSTAVNTTGAGSASPILAEGQRGIKEAAAVRARNRRIEITIDPNKIVEAEKVAQTPVVTAPAEDGENSEVKPLVVPGLDGSLVEGESTMVPVSEADLNPNFVPDNGDGGSAHKAQHKVNEGEWGRGGSDFGNNLNSLGQMAGDGGDTTQYNSEGKRVVKVTPSTADLDARRKETIEAQNEFGLWRDP